MDFRNQAARSWASVQKVQRASKKSLREYSTDLLFGVLVS